MKALLSELYICVNLQRERHMKYNFLTVTTVTGNSGRVGLKVDDDCIDKRVER